MSVFEYDNVASYEYFKHKGLHTNFLTWTALRTCVPKSLKARVLVDEFYPMGLQDAHKDFDIKSVISRHFYKLLLSKKAKLPNKPNRLINDFDVEDTPDEVYLLPHNFASETYVLVAQFITNIPLMKGSVPKRLNIFYTLALSATFLTFIFP